MSAMSNKPAAEELAAWDEEEPRPIEIYSWGIQFGDPEANIAAYMAEHPAEAE
jgi:hypothetical protein